MKKLLIVNNNLATGGVQSSLIHLLEGIKERYDVTLLLFHLDAEDASRVPDGVRLVTVRSPFRHLGMSKSHTRRAPLLFLGRAFWVAITRLLGHDACFWLMSLLQRRIKGYDCAISYLHECAPRIFYGGCNTFVLRCVVSPLKMTWLHGDFSRCGADHAAARRLYKAFDRIVACSQGTMDAFVGRMPACADKTAVVRNCHDYPGIRRMADREVPYEAGVFHIVSVARLSEEKGLERALRAIRVCKDHGYAVRYHIVGDGKQRAALERLSEQLGLGDEVRFYGNQANPYPYVRAADLLLMSSYHEAAPMVLDEAACLGVPVLTTKTISAEEMVAACGSGFVVENDQAAIERQLLAILEDRTCLESIRRSLEGRLFDNGQALACFDGLLS